VKTAHARLADSCSRSPCFSVKTLQLDHQIPSLAYSIEEEYHININKALLQEMVLRRPLAFRLETGDQTAAAQETEFIVSEKR